MIISLVTIGCSDHQVNGDPDDRNGGPRTAILRPGAHAGDALHSRSATSENEEPIPVTVCFFVFKDSALFEVIQSIH